MDRSWRSPVVEIQTATYPKSETDDDDKTLVDEDEERLNIIEHDKLYVFSTKPLKW